MESKSFPQFRGLPLFGITNQMGAACQPCAGLMRPSLFSVDREKTSASHARGLCDCHKGTDASHARGLLTCAKWGNSPNCTPTQWRKLGNSENAPPLRGARLVRNSETPKNVPIPNAENPETPRITQWEISGNSEYCPPLRRDYLLVNLGKFPILSMPSHAPKIVRRCVPI